MIYRVSYPATLIFDVESPKGLDLTDVQVKRLAIQEVEDSGIQDGLDVPVDLMRVGSRFYANEGVRTHEIEIVNRQEE